jgi:hypothetical protein
MNTNDVNNVVSNNTNAYNLGKIFGLMQKTLDKRGFKHDYGNLLFNMKNSTLINMLHMLMLFETSDACTFKKTIELAMIFEGVKEIPHSLSTEEYGHFWLGYYSNFSSAE